jgi:bidirectional [NiFe] hydrogenase diaphorase subunit
VVCTGTACYINGAGELLKAIDETARIRDGETTPDNRLSLLTARCLGACGLAPVVVIDEVVVGKIKPEAMKERIRKLVEEPAQEVGV